MGRLGVGSIVLATFADAAAAGGIGRHEPGGTDDQVACVAITDAPAIYRGLDPLVPLEREIGFHRSFSFSVRVFETGRPEVMGGWPISRHGRLIHRDAALGPEDRDILCVLAEEWDCRPYQGDRSWPRPAP